MDIINAYEQTGSYRGAAALTATTHKTVRRVLERRAAGGRAWRFGGAAPRGSDAVRELIQTRVRETDGRISAKRLLPAARASGFTGSDRSLRRAVTAAKADWRRRRRVFRPWVPDPGQHLLIDYGLVTEGPNRGLVVFTAVRAWSRMRFVRFAKDQTLVTTLRLLAECFQHPGGVPAVVLADRMGCLKGAVVANVVVPTADYVRFATAWRFRPDFCQAADPQSKGAVEHLVGYCKRDLIVPAGDWAGNLAVANAAAIARCAQSTPGYTPRSRRSRPSGSRSNGRCCARCRRCARRWARPDSPQGRQAVHGAVRPARYSVPHRLVGQQVLVTCTDGRVVISTAGSGGRVVAEHPLVGPVETALDDAHYNKPTRPPLRATSPVERK